MKKIRHVIILFTLVVAACAVSMWYTQSITAQVVSKIESIQNDVTNGKSDDALKKSDDLCECWESNQMLLYMIIHHELLDEIEEPIKLLNTNLKNSPDEECDFWLESEKARYRLNNLKKVELPLIENIL